MATRPLMPGERIVCYPYHRIAAGWTFTAPRGELIRINSGVAMVRLDNDGAIRETDVRNVRRAAGWKPPKPSKPASQRPLHRAPPPIEEGWEEPVMFGKA